MERELERLRAEAEDAIDNTEFCCASVMNAQKEKEKLRKKIDIIVQRAYGEKEE
jgi:hypothetical protein